MIIKASQRAGANQLAAHLLNDRDNEHVRVHELRGFAADDLHGAFQEAHAISRGTKCQQFLFSVSFNPPNGALASEADFERAVDAAEQRLGLTGQPRAIIIHEKEGRRHAHAVWSRIDAEEMRAVNMAHFKRKLTTLSRELFLDHDWPLPDGLRTNGGRNPLNFTLAEWQQAKRHGRDPRETKDAIRDAYLRADSLATLKPALEERGYYLAQGDRRGFVVIDTDGEVYALARQTGEKTRALRERLGDPAALPGVDAVKADLARKITSQVKTYIKEVRTVQAREIARDRAQVVGVVAAQRQERALLQERQTRRWTQETRARAARFRTGLAGAWDAVIGRKRTIRAQNEADAIVGLARDRAQRDALSVTQRDQRAPLQAQLDRTRARHAGDRRVLARQIADHRRRLTKAAADTPDRDLNQPTPRRRRGPSLDL